MSLHRVVALGQLRGQRISVGIHSLAETILSKEFRVPEFGCVECAGPLSGLFLESSCQIFYSYSKKTRVPQDSTADLSCRNKTVSQEALLLVQKKTEKCCTSFGFFFTLPLQNWLRWDRNLSASCKGPSPSLIILCFSKVPTNKSEIQTSVPAKQAHR